MRPSLMPLTLLLMITHSISLAETQGAAKISSVAWAPGATGDERRLVIECTAPPSVVDVSTTRDGVTILLGVESAPGAIPSGVTVQNAGGTVRLVVTSSRPEVLGVRASGNRVEIAMPGPDATSSYRIGVGDVLGVVVYKNADLTADYTVSPEGSIKVPLVGDLPATGSTEAELTRRLTELLSTYLVAPQVSVTVRNYQSQYVYVTGAVGQSKRVPLRPGLDLKGVLSEAGVALAPGQELELRHTANVDDHPTTLMAEQLDAPDTPSPADGDVLTIRERAYVFIQGEVRHGGRFVLDRGTTLLQAIAMAEGLTEWANRSEIRIRRQVGSETTETRVNLKRVESRKEVDPEIKPGDVIIVARRVL